MNLAPVRAKALMFLAFAALSACGRPVIAERPLQAGDLVVARVDGRAVWTSDVAREAVTQGLLGQGERLDVTSELFRHTLDAVIDQKLLAGEAAARKLDKDPAAQRRLAAARERVLSDMLVEQVVARAVDDNAVRTVYDAQLKSAKPAQEFRCRQIVVAGQADADAIKRLLIAGAAFDALALKRSIDASTKFNGGDMGYFTLDLMPQAYGAAMKDAKPGEIVGPFKSDAGWVLVKVEDRRPQAPIALDAARPQIVRFLTYDEVRDLLDTLRGHAKVEILPAAATDKANAKP